MRRLRVFVDREDAFDIWHLRFFIWPLVLEIASFLRCQGLTKDYCRLRLS